MSVSGKHLFANSSTWIAAGMLALMLIGTAPGQTVPTSAGRKLAPDALVVIAPSVEPGETFQGPVDLPFVVTNPELKWTPSYLAENETLLEMGTQVVFRGPVRGFEFSFKPVRMIELDIQTRSGVQRKLVWYLIYRIRDVGAELQPGDQPDYPQPTIPGHDKFFPTFTLVSKGLDKTYLDQVIPSAIPLIAAKERVAKSANSDELAELLDSIRIQTVKIEKTTPTSDNAVWGIATWTDIDPRTDFFSVEVRGLTNAQQLQLQGDEIVTQQKTLVLHFSRPGDTVGEIEDRIRYGIPALADIERQWHVLSRFGVQERLDYMWIYR